MTLEQIILYPLTHRMATEANLDRLHGIEQDYANYLVKDATFNTPRLVGATPPLKTKRTYTPRKPKVTK